VPAVEQAVPAVSQGMGTEKGEEGNEKLLRSKPAAGRTARGKERGWCGKRRCAAQQGDFVGLGDGCRLRQLESQSALKWRSHGDNFKMQKLPFVTAVWDFKIY